MRKRKLALGALFASMMFASSANAQLSKNPDKFLGNITTRYQVDYGNEKFYTLWNQITCENESKWGSVEGTNNSFNWGCDNAVNYAKSHKFPFKFHALIWGAQHPSWFNSSMTPENRYTELVGWMDAVKKKYPNLEIIDVANECVSGHQADTYLFQEALGGGGATGWDWLIKAFEMAHERWPNAILIYNDFNTFQWNTDQFIEICKTLRDAGAPIDAYGCQSHDLTDCSFSTFKSSMDKLQNSLKMPMYSTEYDIGTSDDALQKQRYSEQIPYMWEKDYCAGITLWGYIYGTTWTTDGNSGIIKDGKDRPAMKWLREYMKSEKALNAKSPFPGMVKEASVYVKPEALNVEKGNTTSITVRAKMKTKIIEKIELYAKNKLIATMTEAPYVAEYTPTATGTEELKAVVTCTDGFTWTRYSQITVCNPRAPYKNKIQELPGTLQCENFDTGADGIAFHDNNSQKQGDASSYRTDATGIDIGKNGSNYVVGYGEVGEWMEYTVNVKEAGLYSYDITYSAPNDCAVSLAKSTSDGLVYLTDQKQTLYKTSSWSTYKVAHGRLIIPLEEGEQRLRLSITGGSDQYVVNLDKIVFTRIDINDGIKVALSSDPDVATVSTKVKMMADVEAAEGTEVQSVKFYQNGLLTKTITAAPFEYTLTPSAKGTFAMMAIAIDADGKQSNIANYTLKVNPKRVAYKTVNVPGDVVEAENFDKGEEGFTFHDSDSKDEEPAKYRTDNEGVDIVTGNNGYVIGWTSANEWLEYTINVVDPGLYTCEMTASNGSSTSGSVTFSLVGDDGKLTTLWSISCAGTGAWSTYKVRKSTAKKELLEGKHIIRVTFKNGNVNLDKFELKCAESYTGLEDLSVDVIPAQPVSTFNLSGQKVDSNYRGIVIKNGKKILQK